MFANPWGSLMAVLVALFLSVPAAFIYRKIRTRKGAAIGILVGAVLAIVVAAGEQPDCHADLRAHDLPSCGRDDSADSAAVQRG